MTKRSAVVAVKYPQEAKAHPTPAHGQAHGHAHESPPVMLAPLVILAVLSIVGGWIGVPKFLGGSAHFEHFLAPVMEAGAPQVAASEAAEPSEWLLTIIATSAGLLGFLLAWYMYHLRVGLADRIQQRVRGLYDTLAHKYYIDEIYDAVFVQPILALSTAVLWRGVDVNTIDGAVNGSAAGARSVGDVLRRMQSGNLRSYAGWIAAGAAAIVVYMVWSGVGR
jgi:NADH-quinone oxidoreductase subunit L